MDTLTERRTTSFVVRVWQEPGKVGAPPLWRGQIEEVTSGEVSNFQLSMALIEFLARIVQRQRA